MEQGITTRNFLEILRNEWQNKEYKDKKGVNGQELLRATKNRKAIIAYIIKDHDIYVCMYNKEKTKIICG